MSNGRPVTPTKMPGGRSVLGTEEGGISDEGRTTEGEETQVVTMRWAMLRGCVELMKARVLLGLADKVGGGSGIEI